MATFKSIKMTSTQLFDNIGDEFTKLVKQEKKIKADDLRKLLVQTLQNHLDDFITMTVDICPKYQTLMELSNNRTQTLNAMETFINCQCGFSHEYCENIINDNSCVINWIIYDACDNCNLSHLQTIKNYLSQTNNLSQMIDIAPNALGRVLEASIKLDISTTDISKFLAGEGYRYNSINIESLDIPQHIKLLLENMANIYLSQ